MKTAFILLLISIGIASAQTNTNSAPIFISFTNTLGEYITNAEVVSHSANKLIYRVDGGLGGGTIRLEKLPPELQARFNYDPDEANKADQIEKDKKAAQDQYWQQQKELVEQQAQAVQEPASRQAAAHQAALEVSASIRSEAERKWPGDYDMQLYEINKQTEAYNWVYAANGATGVPSDIFFQIKSDAAGKWPRDYDMQKYEITKQVNAYVQIH